MKQTKPLPPPDLLDEERCEVHEGEERSDRCPLKATRIVREPFTPGRFKIHCCEEHAQGLIRNGYAPDPAAESANGTTARKVKV